MTADRAAPGDAPAAQLRPAARGGPGRPLRERADAATCRRCPTARSSRSTGRSAPGPAARAEELLGVRLPGPAHRRRPGVPRDPPGAAAADAGRGAGDRAGRRPGRRLGAAVPDQRRRGARRRTARRCWCGRRCSRRPPGGGTSGSCSARSGRPRSPRRGRATVQRVVSDLAAATSVADVAAVVVRPRPRGAGAPGRGARAGRGRPARRTERRRSCAPARRRGCRPSCCAQLRAAAGGQLALELAQGVRTVAGRRPAARRAGRRWPRRWRPRGLSEPGVVPVTADSRRLGVLVLGLGAAAATAT